MTSARQYRLSPLDSTGWLFGLSGEQCVVLTASILLSGLFLDVHLNSIVIVTPLIVGLVVAFLKMNALTVPQQLGLLIRRMTLRLTKCHEWKNVNLFTDLPFLRHIEVVATDDGVGILHDLRNQTITASFVASATAFSLLDTDLQDASLHAWGDAVTPLVEARSKASISWHETTGALIESEELAQHRLIICVSIDLRRTRKTNDKSPLVAGVDALVSETRLLAERLSNIGIAVDALHSPAQTHGLVASRLSPAAYSPTLTLGCLVRPLGRSHDFAGLTRRSHVAVGAAFHRTYWIEQWPRTSVNASWMESILFSEDGQRTISLHMRPVSAVDSRRRIDRSATKLETDAQQRVKAGFRVGDAHRRSTQHLGDRETEIGDGFAEFTYSGFITISSTCVETLYARCTSWEQRAASVGIRMIPLDDRHDLGLAASLPLGQSPLGPRL